LSLTNFSFTREETKVPKGIDNIEGVIKASPGSPNFLENLTKNLLDLENIFFFLPSLLSLFLFSLFDLKEIISLTNFSDKKTKKNTPATPPPIVAIIVCQKFNPLVLASGNAN
jgi:hypothetical protein